MKHMDPADTARCVMFVVDVRNLPGTIEEQREALLANLAEYQSIKRWAFILHDRDGVGEHWQGVAQMDKNIDGQTWAKRLGVNGVMKLAGGGRALIWGLRYLTHESEPSKTQYPRTSIVATPGWDWESELDTAIIRDSAKGSSSRKKMIASVQDGQLTALEAIRRGGCNERAIRAARATYLRQLGSEELPAVRVNFYVQGPAHPCRDRLAEALARTLSTAATFYRFEGRDFDAYDGEDVVLMGAGLSAWGEYIGDCYIPTDGIGKLGGPRELFSMLSATPRTHAIATSSGKTQLIHRNTVIVGEEPFEQFRSRLSLLYEKTVEDHHDQSYLSLPVFVPVDATTFGVQVSERFALGRGEFEQFLEARRYTLGLVNALTDSRHLPQEQRSCVVRELETRQTTPILAAGSLVAEAMQPTELSTDEVLDRYANIGQPVVEGRIV